MFTDIKKYITSFAIGIRFSKNFSLMDRFGSIVDDILYSKDSYFSPSFFPFVNHERQTERIFHNIQNTDDEKYRILTFNVNNVILEMKSDNLNEIDFIIEAFKSQIIDKIFDKYKISQFIRIGFIYKYEIESEDLCDSFLSQTVGNSLQGVNDINLRFSKKYPIIDAKIQKEINDYYNSIYTITKKSDENKLIIHLDYQRFFLPIIDIPEMIEFDKFIKKVNHFRDNDFLNWLNLYTSTEQYEKSED